MSRPVDDQPTQASAPADDAPRFRGVPGALLRFRVIAYVVGVVLVTLMLVAMPLKYLFDRPHLVETIGPAHGFLYMGYLVLAFDLVRRLGWPFTKMLLIMAAGTIPFVSFYAERRVTRDVKAQSTARPVTEDTSESLPQA